MVGDIVAFIQYVRSFNQPLAQVANIANVLQSTLAAAERVFAFLEEPEESADPMETASTDSIRGTVTFDHVHFGYNPEQTVIKDFSATIHQGQKVAIVGPTGAGKTTMVKLLMRFYDVRDGSIQIDGTDIRQFSRSDLRGLFGMVLQDTHLFGGTVRENIRYGRLDASDEEVEQAAIVVGADTFIRRLPDGFDTELGEAGGGFSQGQRQLIAIARAILARPAVLILDEATSSVDTRTEMLLQQAMIDLRRGRTSFIIAHRLSTIREADEILVIDHGEIIERGNHQSLMHADTFYRRMYQGQFAESNGSA